MSARDRAYSELQARGGVDRDAFEAALDVYDQLHGVSPDVQATHTLTAVRAAHTEYQRTGELHELARAMNSLLGV